MFLHPTRWFGEDGALDPLIFDPIIFPESVFLNSGLSCMQAWIHTFMYVCVRWCFERL